jgi:hypothetical protein
LQGRRNVQGKLDDCIDYFAVNRLFLSADLINAIWSIFYEAGNKHSLISIALAPSEIPLSYAAWINYIAKIEDFASKVYVQSERLENLYRSVADITTEDQ